MSLIPCPCGHQIHVTLEQLLMGVGGRCPGCGAVLTLDPGRNAEALAALKRVTQKIQAIQSGDWR